MPLPRRRSNNVGRLGHHRWPGPTQEGKRLCLIRSFELTTAAVRYSTFDCTLPYSREILDSNPSMRGGACTASLSSTLDLLHKANAAVGQPARCPTRTFMKDSHDPR